MLVCLALLTLLSAAIALPSGLLGPNNAPLRREKHRSQVNITYTPNWAGAIWDEGNGTFSSITGTFTVPTPTGSIGDSAAVWVGLDGVTCATAMLQTGISFTVEGGQTAAYSAWYEWYPTPASNFSDIAISSGDILTLSVSASSPTSATVKIENLTNGQTASTDLNSAFPLCGQNAEWIVEDYLESANSTTDVPFANFGTIVFTNAVATGDGPVSYTPSGATIMDIKQKGQVLTSVSMDDSSVTIKYV